MVAAAPAAAKAAAPSQPAEVQPAIRRDFADTAAWVPDVQIGPGGTAEVSFRMPDNLTTWKARLWCMGHGTRVAEITVELVTRKNLMVRLITPRFLVERDRATLTAIVHNYLKRDKDVRVVLEVLGEALKLAGPAERRVHVPAGGQAVVEWPAIAAAEGEVRLRVKALTDEESDALERPLPVVVHGILKTEAWSGAIDPDGRAASVTVRVPAERRPELSRLELRWSPSIAAALVDALPYLIDYPYGCTEQTLNRFLPAVVVQRTLIEMGIDLEAIRQKRVNLNPQELGKPRQRAAGWKRFERNPVFSTVELQRVVTECLQRLAKMQLSDGGWGWFSGWAERSSPHLTALIVHGLLLAKKNDVAVERAMIQRGIDWLAGYQQRQLKLLDNFEHELKPAKRHADNTDALVFKVLAEAGRHDNSMSRMANYLYRDRLKLAPYAQALFALGLHALGQNDRLAMVLRNLSQFLVQDEENQTAWLALPAGTPWWCWYGSEIEADAHYLQLLVRTDPHNPVAPRLAKYLLNNRKHATYWNSTRDTAICIEALVEYLKASGETKPDMTVEVWYDGQRKKRVAVTAENLFAFDNTLVLEGEQLTSGAHKIELRKRGRGPVYFNLYLTNFTLEDPIAHAGLEIKVRRNYYKLVPKKRTAPVAGQRGQPVRIRRKAYERVPLPQTATLNPGDVVEVELIIDSKNDYEYIVIEDNKAAGLEPLALRSGYHYDGLGAYMELRARRTCLFLRRVPRGKHNIVYKLRVETPGSFSALPTQAYGMYAPELKANSDERKVLVQQGS